MEESTVDVHIRPNSKNCEEILDAIALGMPEVADYSEEEFCQFFSDLLSATVYVGYTAVGISQKSVEDLVAVNYNLLESRGRLQ